MNGAGNVALFRLQKPVLVVGIVALVACVTPALMNHAYAEQFFRSYLIGFTLVVGASVGALALLMIQYLTGGVWGILIRRQLEGAAKSIPLLAVAFLPILFGLDHIYAWAGPEAAKSEILRHKAAYLSFTPFLVRAIIYFVSWSLFAYLLTRWDRRYEQTGDPWVALRMRGLSGFGLVFLAFSVTFAAVDWMMSLEPGWYSTMYPVNVICGDLLSAMALSIVLLVAVARVSPVSEAALPLHFRDLGNLMFAFVILWAYTVFSEFLLIWYGNIREEVPFHLKRMQGGWGFVSIALIALHFFLPFFLLLLRAIKDKPGRLAGVALLILFMRVIDYYWKIIPSFGEAGHPAVSVHWMDIVAVVGLAGVWLFFVIGSIRKGPLLPMYEPFVQKALGGEAVHHD
jgi:hypothetical protein